jgi:hypothetical protein
MRTDENGTAFWIQTYSDDTGSLRIKSVIETILGGFAIVGFQSGQENYICLILTDSNGRILYQRQYSSLSDFETGEGGDDYGSDIIEHSTGGYVIAGTMDDKLSLIRVDAIGNLLWYESYHTTGHGDGYSLVETEGGGIVVVGEHTGTAKVIHTDSGGNIIWETIIQDCTIPCQNCTKKRW